MNKLNKLISAALVALSVNSFAGTCPAFSGEYVIGKSEKADFSTITEAMDAVKCGGVSAPVTFVLEKGTYSEKVVISTIPGVSAFNPVKFESMTGNNADVIISYGKTDAALVISSPYVSFENMTVSHKEGTYGNSMRVEGKASSLHFKGVIFDGVQNAPTGAENAAVYFTATASKSDIAFEDCEVNNGSMGLWKSGVSAATPDTKTSVSGTLFFGQTEAGLVLVNEDAPFVSDNVVSAVANKKDFKGISLDNVSNRMIVSRNIMNAASGSTGLMMNNCMAQPEAPGQINNNTLGITGSTESLGICLTGNTDNLVFNFNRVKLAKDAVHASDQAYYKNTSTGNNINMLNNIFIDTNTGIYTVIGNSYKDYFNQLPGQSNPTLSASANSLSMEKVSAIK